MSEPTRMDGDQLCRAILASAPDAVLFADREGAIRLWNPGAEAIFGWSESEALGRSLDLIIPESLRNRHWTGFRQVMETGQTRYGRELLSVPAVHKDGRRLSVEFSVSLVRDGAGSLAGVAAILRDVTERWTRDRDLKRRLADLEAQVRPAPGGRK